MFRRLLTRPTCQAVFGVGFVLEANPLPKEFRFGAPANVLPGNACDLACNHSARSALDLGTTAKKNGC